MAQYQQPISFLSDSLYCDEDNWEISPENYFEEQESCYGLCLSPNPSALLDQDLFWEEDELSDLFSKEERIELRDDIGIDPSLMGCRREAVEWMLKVVGHYSFSALTAVLAVNYLDRFLHKFQFQREKPWMTQLAAVACLSLAAKVEETQVPLLLDFQVEETKYLFEAKTIQRMEILVLSTLQWKMNPVTPLSFLDFITRRLGLKNHLCWEFLKRCEFLLVSVISDYRFMMAYLPSVIATATMLHVVNGVDPCLGAEYQTQLLGILGIDKEKVEDCCKLIREISSRTQFQSSHKRKFGSNPGSPKGVMDASFSSDSSNDSWETAKSVSSSPEPMCKKNRAQEQHLLSIHHR